MKYRIKIVTYKDGKVSYIPQYYRGFLFGWLGIQYDGELGKSCEELSTWSSREEALRVIDKAKKGAVKVKTIEFEYINKNR